MKINFKDVPGERGLTTMSQPLRAPLQVVKGGEDGDIPPQSIPRWVTRMRLHEIIYHDGRFSSLGGTQFDPHAYSRFKYGHEDIAQAYGRELAKLVAERLATALETGEPITITGTAYRSMPNAASRVAHAVYWSLKEAGFNVIYSRIYRMILTEGDYGRMSEADRLSATKRKSLSVDPGDYEGRHVVVIDDIKITGTIEQSSLDFFSNMPILSLTLAHVLQLNQTLHEPNPGLEGLLNQTAIKNLDDLWQMIYIAGSTEEFPWHLNARTAKFILEADEEDLKKFLNRMIIREPDELRYLHESLMEDGYDRMAAYRRNAQLIELAISKKGDSGSSASKKDDPPAEKGFRLSKFLARWGL